MRRKHALPAALAIVSLILFAILGYGLDRHETAPLFACYFTLFAIYCYIIRRVDADWFRFWIFAALLYRFTFLFSIPSLSDDFYRFIWDGRLLAAGLSPFTQVPAFYMEAPNVVPGLDAELFEKLNSKHRFSSYPPVCQLAYWFAVRFTDSIFVSVLILKVILFLFELGTLWIMTRLIDLFQASRTTLLLYALNPLVIVEIMGNVHFEGVMVFFLLVAIYMLQHKSRATSAVSFAFSVCTKLIPLLFLPLLAKLLGWGQALRYWILTAAFTGILFLPLIEKDLIAGFSTSLGYYFQRFEFNASIYYVVREVGFWIFGFNIIQYAGPLLALVAAALILRISFKDVDQQSFRGDFSLLFHGMLWCLLVYFVSTTILHPWYIITLLAVSLFTRYRFPVVWTGLIFLTYAGYTRDSFEENSLLVIVEYVALFSYIMFETVWKYRQSHS